MALQMIFYALGGPLMMSMVHHIETMGLVQKISALFSLYRAILLVLGMFYLNSGEVALFSFSIFISNH